MRTRSKRHPQDALILRANPQFVALHMQASYQKARRQHSREAAAIKFRDAHRCSDIRLVSSQGDGLHLAIWQSLFFGKRFRRSRMPMLDALVESSYPQIHLGTRKRLDIYMA